MFDSRLLFALILSGLLALGSLPANPDRNGSPTLSTPSAVAPIEVEPETRS